MKDSLLSVKTFFEGTHTALALKHATDISFRSSNGNRPDAEDIIFLLTDGISTPGDIKPPIEKLRKNKIKVKKTIER